MKIEKCNVCGSTIENILNLKNLDIIGMQVGEYEQQVCLCNNCSFIFTANPFSPEQLINRYSNMSKFEFDDSTYFLGEQSEYIKRSKRQKDFIYNADITFNSIL